jgi:hypothetical protein
VSGPAGGEASAGAPDLTPPADPARWSLPRLRVDADGAWLHEDTEVTHPGILASLRAGLRADAEGYHLRIGPVRVPVVVDDAPLAVVRLEAGPGGFAVTLGDGAREALDLDSLRLGPGDVPYCRAGAARLPARFSRAAAWTLLQHVDAGDPDAPMLRVPGGGRRPLPRGPRPAPSGAD